MFHIRTRGVACIVIVSTALASCSQRPASVAEADKASATKALALTTGDATLTWGPCPSLMPAGCQISVLRGDPAKPNADIFLRVPAGAQIAAHSHTSAERMVLVGGELEVTYQGQDPTRLTIGTYAYGPANLAHKATCLSAEPCTLFIAFEAPVDAKAYEGPAF